MMSRRPESINNNVNISWNVKEYTVISNIMIINNSLFDYNYTKYYDRKI